jgi:hypothetical protein
MRQKRPLGGPYALPTHTGTRFRGPTLSSSWSVTSDRPTRRSVLFSKRNRAVVVELRHRFEGSAEIVCLFHAEVCGILNFSEQNANAKFELRLSRLLRQGNHRCAICDSAASCSVPFVWRSDIAMLHSLYGWLRCCSFREHSERIGIAPIQFLNLSSRGKCAGCLATLFLVSTIFVGFSPFRHNVVSVRCSQPSDLSD